MSHGEERNTMITNDASDMTVVLVDPRRPSLVPVEAIESARR